MKWTKLKRQSRLYDRQDECAEGMHAVDDSKTVPAAVPLSPPSAQATVKKHEMAKKGLANLNPANDEVTERSLEVAPMRVGNPKLF